MEVPPSTSPAPAEDRATVTVVPPSRRRHEGCDEERDEYGEVDHERDGDPGLEPDDERLRRPFLEAGEERDVVTT